MLWQSDQSGPTLAARLSDPRLRLLYEHWIEIRGNRPLPARRSVDPVKIPSVLSSVFICDYERAAGRLRYSLVGEDVRTRYGCEIIGRYQDELFQGLAREALLRRIRTLMETPAISYSYGEVHGFAGRHGAGERLALPLASDGINPDSLIGAVAFQWEGGADFTETDERMTYSFWSLDGMRQIGCETTGSSSSNARN